MFPVTGNIYFKAAEANTKFYQIVTMKESIFKLHKSVFAVSLSLLLLSLAGIVLVNCKVPQVKTLVKLEQGFLNPP